LLEKDFICPHCALKVASLDKLAIDRPMRRRVADYITKEIEASQREEDGQITNEGTPTGSVSQVMISPHLMFFLSFSPYHDHLLLKTDTRAHRLPPSTTSSPACTRRKTCPQTWRCPR
jgi:hypothetical protein